MVLATGAFPSKGSEQKWPQFCLAQFAPVRQVRQVRQTRHIRQGMAGGKGDTLRLFTPFEA